MINDGKYERTTKILAKARGRHCNISNGQHHQQWFGLDFQF
jgi:hypothetical protein